MAAIPGLDHRLSVAPMMDVTDRHCRYFLRQITRRSLLYTEMVTSGALIHGDVERHLRFHPEEHPVALQLGGSEPDELAHCAALGERYGYDEINLNIGCPSERVQRGAFGACLMAEPALVAECVAAMQRSVAIPVTVKHRIGIDHSEDYAFLHRFVDTVAASGCRTFIVHARNAILKGLTPKQNREIPPLRYDFVQRLKGDFPQLDIVVNGGIRTWAEIEQRWTEADGVMIGRAAQNDPWLLAQADRRAFGESSAEPTRTRVVSAMTRYAEDQTRLGTPLRHIVRHLHGLYRGRPVARRWRRMLSDHAALRANDAGLLLRALEAVEQREFVLGEA
ncbi:MAG: tRNA dihydrouridine(20/20a) synthase DusA [Burkholderiales bacterium]|nr:tRNA dihydrouridine(20/20a) synthase DusA [Burkholderiales bacterium]